MASPAVLVVAVRVEVPVNVPGPLLMLIVTVTPLSATTLPKLSSAWTVTAGAMALPQWSFPAAG